MTVLSTYNEFSGRHWDTGTICNVLAYQGIAAPHTGQPFSEALLLGISGGITAMYLVFEYQGFEPQVTLGTRYPFEPMERIWERLRLNPDVRETTSETRAVDNLRAALAADRPAIVWADLCSMPYNTLHIFDENFWVIMPLVVYGYDEGIDIVSLADRAQVPLHASTAQLATARGRTQKNQYKLVTLAPLAAPTAETVAQAVRAGIRDGVALFLDGPPKGPPRNFGQAALQTWADMLTDTKSVKRWSKVFATGSELYAGLTAAYGSIESWETGGAASRSQYADFLDEARVLLDLPALSDIAQQFRQSAQQWRDLAAALLPASVPPLHVTRTLLTHKDRLFGERGAQALDEIRQVDERLDQIRGEVAQQFPLSAAEVATLREELRERVLAIRATEQAAMEALRVTQAITEG
ncbi:MAG: BtrH N-terminal domain-containing protein [Chloroflexaceae bacterium]|nr:BtrH N-terminal domain-containing protein [Chloroflexaceae bacterium]